MTAHFLPVNRRLIKRVYKLANNRLSTNADRLAYISESFCYFGLRLNSWKAELRNSVLTYQQFVDRNLQLKKREDELHASISELEIKKACFCW